METQKETQIFVQEAREKLGLTQSELAEKLDSNKFNISNYETGRATPPGDIILKIQELLKAKGDGQGNTP